jgi:hypothetical protein
MNIDLSVIDSFALIKTPADSRREKGSNHLAMKPYLTPYAPIVLPSE